MDQKRAKIIPMYTGTFSIFDPHASFAPFIASFVCQPLSCNHDKREKIELKTTVHGFSSI